MMAATLKEHIVEYRLEREQRYARFEVLLQEALDAAAAAADAVVPEGKLGAVLVKTDGGSSFACFLKARGEPGWKRTKKDGFHLRVEFPDAGVALAWAVTFRDILARGGVHVQIGQNLLEKPLWFS